MRSLFVLAFCFILGGANGANPAATPNPRQVMEALDRPEQNFPVLRRPQPITPDRGIVAAARQQGGIHAILNNLGDNAMITSVFPGGPAAKADLVPGDLLLKVDDASVRSSKEAVKLIRGQPGTKVRLLVDHEHTTRTVEIERASMILPGNFDLYAERGADLAALAKIQMPPDHPTRDQVRQYILDIFRASAGQNTASTAAPQVAMLEKVGHKNLDLLIDLTPRNSISIFSTEAISHLVQPEDRDLIISRLPHHSFWLLQIVEQQGWQKEAEPYLLSVLQKKPESLASNIVPMLASLHDPASFDELTYGFKVAPSKYPNFQLLLKVPGFDLQAAVDQAWEYQKSLPRHQPHAELSRGKADSMLPLSQ